MGDPSTGDRVWYATLELLSRQEGVTVSDVLDELDDPPSRQTVYRRLSSIEELGLLNSEPGSGSAPTVWFDSDAEARLDGGVRHAENYRLRVHNVGGREPDGTPTYLSQWTFDVRMLREIVEGAIEGRTLNACAGKTRLNHDDEIVRNDLNPERDADHHHDVTEIDALFRADSFDSVVYDPPFDQSQSDEHYDGMHARAAGPARRKLAELVRPGGVFVEVGWNDHSPALGLEGWHREACHRFRRGPSYQPYFLSVDRRDSRQTTLG